MKKILSVLLCLTFCFCLAACGNSGDVDFKSIKDADTGKVYSLGDAKSKFDDDFGASEESEYGYFSYLNGSLEVTYVDDKAIEITVDGDTNRFTFRDMKIDMTSEDLAGRFTEGFGDEYSSFHKRFYDANGKDVQEDQAVYIASVHMAPKGSMFKEEGGVLGLSIMLYEYYK